jgi:adenylate kinase
MNLILLGAPGSGKGTQAAFISQELGVSHIASGDLFRGAQSKKTELGLLAKSYMEKGMLVPDEITIRMILERLAAPDCGVGYILDGFPRTLEQAKALDKALAEKGSAIDKVIYIRVSDKELISRLSGRWICRNCQTPYHLVNSPPKVAGKCDKCGGELYQRADDKVETVKKRLDVYYTQTAPLVEYYRTAGKLEEINGEQGVEGVKKEVLATLRK